MNKGTDFDYNYPSKRHYRRTVWNQIVDHLAVPTKDAVVLYLSGQSDFDRSIALQKGFRPNNLICIDKDQRVIAALREGDRLAIRGRLEDVVNNWGPGCRAHVIYGDFCCGLSKPVADLVARLPWLPSFQQCVCAFTLMRGRDAWSNKIREVGQTKHRGECLFALMIGQAMTLSGKLPVTDDFVNHQELYRPLVGKESELNEEFYSMLVEFSQPVYHSYKSTSGQVFDCTVYSNPPMLDTATDMQFVDSSPVVRAMSKIDMGNPVTRRALAVKAVRTMRLAA